MNKLERKYITLNTVEGSFDAYSSISLDFTGVRDKLSLTVNGENCDNQVFYVVVKDNTKFLGFYLGDLNKKSDSKYELKKECGKLGSTLYTLKDVVAVEVVDKGKNKVLYRGLSGDNVGFNGKYTVVVDKPVVVRKDKGESSRGVAEEVADASKEREIEIDSIADGEVNIDVLNVVEDHEVEEDLVVDKEVSSDLIRETATVEFKAYKYEDIDEVETGEMKKPKPDQGGGSGSGYGGGDQGGGSGSGYGGGDQGDGNGQDCDCKPPNHKHECNCHECKYKIYFEDQENENIYLNEDFEIFSRLYENYLRNEYFSNIDRSEESSTNLRSSSVTPSKLNPLDNRNNENITTVIKSTFKNTVDNRDINLDDKKIEKDVVKEKKTEEKRSRGDDNFYDHFMGAKGKNKGNSFIDMITHVKREFESIREIMSLSDEEFARRAENEYKNSDLEPELQPDLERKTKVPTFGVKGLKELIESRVEFKPFEMQEHEVSWVQIKLNEVVGFFDNYWKLFWEPFVVDAYTENRHLLLGVEKVKGKENYFFGVPAFYSVDVVNKAFELGFELFEVVGNNIGEITDGVRGYFIKELKPAGNYDGVKRTSKESVTKESQEKESQDKVLQDYKVSADIEVFDDSEATADFVDSGDVEVEVEDVQLNETEEVVELRAEELLNYEVQEESENNEDINEVLVENVEEV